MPPPTNLNRYRKARARVEAQAQAATNRAKFGRTKVEKQLQNAAEAKAARDLDALRLKPTD